jgi:DNA-directed RNA polymerase sigma subunit (sigma70/sigma32)
MNLRFRSVMMSYREVGDLLGLSPGRVCQIEQRALAKLRKAFLRLGIVDFRGSDGKEAEHQLQHQRKGP